MSLLFLMYVLSQYPNLYFPVTIGTLVSIVYAKFPYNTFELVFLIEDFFTRFISRV